KRDTLIWAHCKEVAASARRCGEHSVTASTPARPGAMSPQRLGYARNSQCRHRREGGPWHDLPTWAVKQVGGNQGTLVVMITPCEGPRIRRKVRPGGSSRPKKNRLKRH